MSTLACAINANFEDFTYSLAFEAKPHDVIMKIGNDGLIAESKGHFDAAEYERRHK